MSYSSEKNELEVFILQTQNPQEIELSKDVLLTATWLLEYEFINNNNTLGVADDMYLILNVGDMKGGTATASNNTVSFIGSNEVPLSTAQTTNSGPQRFQFPVLLAKNTGVGKRRFTFTLKNSTGQLYVPASGDWQVLYRIKYAPLAVGRPSMDLKSPFAAQSWAMAHN